MATLLITYDLNKETKRPQILKDIRSFDSWAILSESSYAVNTHLSPTQVYDFLSKHLDSNDNCYVIRLGRPYDGQGPKKVNDWLADNLSGQFVN